ncbi:putative Acyl- synthetase family member 2 mitochondrial [Seiridium cardinale]
MSVKVAASGLSEVIGDPHHAEPAVLQRLKTAASRNDKRLAVVSTYQQADLYGISTNKAGHEYLRWSYAELEVAVDKFVSSLSHFGIREGERIATFLPNGVEFLVAYWGALRLHCPFVPFNPKSLENQDEAEYLLRTADVSVVLIQEASGSRIVDSIQDKGHSLRLKIVLSDELPNATWTLFASMLKHDNSSFQLSSQDHEEISDQLIAILFTSGTTSRPKGVPHTNTTINAFCRNLSLGACSPLHVFCSVLPNNHAMGFFFPLHYLMHGGTVVFSSPVFDSLAMIKALEVERVTHTAIVPTVLHALIEAIDTRNNPLDSSLLDVCLSGSSVTSENVRQSLSILKSKGVSTGFGMTEGSPVWTGPRQDPADLLLGDSVISGTVVPGARVRICAPGSQTILPRGQAGEVHQSGPGTIKSYLGGQRGVEQFYQDEQGQVWFITGDQGIMHPDGRFSITGRYKDVIIRGGENIASAAIEAVISPYCRGQGCVVGAPDAIAGEVPVLILPEAHISADGEMRKAVLNQLGAIFVPERTYTLGQLGLEDFPKTTSGKIQKSQLAARVRALVDEAVVTGPSTLNDPTGNQLLVAYHRSSGVPIDNLDVNTPVRQFADSITLMRVREYLRKAIGRTISMQDMVDNPTISAQMKLLQRQIPVPTGRRQINQSPLQRPDREELAILFGGQQAAEGMIRTISQVVEAKRLNWSQVSSVIPVHDYLQVLLDSKIIDTWNFTIAVSTKESNAEVSSVSPMHLSEVPADQMAAQKLRTALRKALANNPILTSFVVRDLDGNAYYITLNSDDVLWDLCISDHGVVETTAEIDQMTMDFVAPDMSKVPGPLIFCLLVHVKETNSMTVLFHIHHIVQDASSFRLFLEDLNEALTYPDRSLDQHMSFKMWSDSYLYLRQSPAATNSVRFHVDRLSDLHTHRAAIYPPARLPRQANTSTPDGLDYGFDAPELIQLREEYPDISAAIILKTAMALVNVHRTGHSHAAFCNFEAGRRQFPFVPRALQESAPEAFEVSDINGPVMQAVCNLIEVRRHETVIDMLHRMGQDQDDLTKHAHAPLRRIIEELNIGGNGAGDAIVDVHRAQFTTWVPGLLGDYEKLQVAKLAIRCAAGLVVVAGLGGDTATTYLLSLRWDEANYSREETAEFVNDLQIAVRWIIATENREREIRECLDFLGKGQQK